MISKKDSSSSNESSDDEEEQRRISEAVLGVGASLYNQSEKADNKDQNGRDVNLQEKAKTYKRAWNTNLNSGVDVTKLKSNRPQDRNDDDLEPLLQTTPEFRAHVAKQLSSLLQRDLSECVVENAWEPHIKAVTKLKGGVRLFSHSSKLCEFNNSGSHNKEEPKLEPRKKKIRLSSSSESSDDEDIKACVYTIADMEQENLQLAKFEEGKSAQDSNTNKFETGESLQLCHTTSKTPSDSKIKEEMEGKRKKKKKKKSKHLLDNLQKVPA